MTTKEKILAIAKHLAVLTDEQIQILISDASIEVDSLQVDEKHKEKLTRYLAAHYGSLDIRQTQSETVGPIQRSYATGTNNQGLNATPYGQEYVRLVNKYSQKKINLMVL